MAPPASKKSKMTVSSSSLSGGKGASSKAKGKKPAAAPAEPVLQAREEGLDDLQGSSGPEDEDNDMMDDEDDEFDVDADLSEGDESGDDSEGGMDTEDEIEAAGQPGGPAKSKKTAKRKRRATSPSAFGATLTSILATAPSTTTAPSKKVKKTTSAAAQVQSANILSLAPSIKKTISARQLETKARRVLQASRQEKEDKGRIRDVLGGWGGREDGVGGQEWERSLRKVAQKGVVRLFNTILLSSTQAEEAKSHSTRLEAPEPLPDPKKKAGKDNILGRGSRNAEGSRVTKEGFEALLKGGGL